MMGSENDASQKIRSPLYWNQIIKHQTRNPALNWLNNFFRRQEEYKARLAVLEFFQDKVEVRKFDDAPDLESYWQSLCRNEASSKKLGTTGKECKGRLYILEDLSKAYISALGSHFNLDPMIFVQYGFTPVYSETNPNDLERQPPWMLQQLFSTRMESEALTLLYYEVRELGKIEREELMDKNFRWETCSNVPRRIVQIDREKGTKPGFVRRNVTFWSRQSDENRPWDALVIVDPGIGGKLKFSQKVSRDNINEHPWANATEIECQTDLYLKGYPDFSGWPTSCENEKAVCTPLNESSTFDEIIEYWQHAPRHDIEAAIKNPAYTALFALKIVASSWLLLLTYLSNVVSTLETALHHFEGLGNGPRASSVAEEISRLRTQLRNLNRMRRYFWWYIYHMRSNLEAIGLPTATSSSNLQRTARLHVPGLLLALASPILDDFLAIYDHLLLMQKNIDSLMPVVMGASSLLEAQLSSLDTKSVLRLTIMALVFVPISSTTGVFSMAEKYLPGQPDSWVVALVCVPLLLFVFSLAFGEVIVRRLKNWWSQKREQSLDV